MLSVLNLVLVQSRAGEPDRPSLESGFVRPPEDTKPYCYWYWISDNISREGITRDLEAMAHVGIGEVYIGNVDVNPGETGAVKVLSEEWWKMVDHAVREGKRLGVNIGVFNCPGWSQSGGPWVAPTQTMRYIVSSEVRVHGPAKFDAKLPAPDALFQDVATLAFPAPALDADNLAAHGVRIVRCTPSVQGAANLLDGNLGTACTIPFGSPPVVIDTETDAPCTVRSLTMYSDGKPLTVTCELQAADEGGTNFETVRTVVFDRHNLGENIGPIRSGPVTASFPAVTSRHFRFVLTHASGGAKEMGAVAEVELSGKAKLESYVDKQLGKMFQAPQAPWDFYMWPPQSEPDQAGLVVPPAQVINLTSHVSPDGRLDWDAPPGDWIILRSGITPTGVHNAPASPEGKGYEIDKMSRPLVDYHFEQFIGKLLARLPATERTALKHVIADCYEQGSQNWTDGLAEDFQKRYGYDPLPYLPVMTGRIVGSADQSDRFLWDLRRIVADRISYDYVGGLRDTLEKNGLRLWLENYGHWGYAGEFLQYGGQSSELGGEFWTSGELGDVELRDASSAAHTYGKSPVYAEAWTSGGPAWTLDPWALKKRGDWAMTEGINHFVLHVYIEQPTERKPGINAPFGTEFNRHNTWFNQAGPFFDYLRRTHFVLRQGLYVADAAYFIGEDAPKMTGTRQPALPPGYSFDYINAEVIETRLQVKDGRFVLPDRMSYRVLVLPPQETMRPGCLRKIRDLVAAGGAGVGAPPVRSPSLQNFPACDREVAELAGELWKDCDGVTHTQANFGQGQVFRGVEMPAVFARLDVQADLRWSGGGAPGPFIHRHTAEGEVYFLCNQSDETRRVTADFRIDERQPELWDPVTGNRRDLPEFVQAAGRTQVPLEFAPRQSMLIVFRKAPAGGKAPGESFPAPVVAGELKGPWEVSFDPKWGGPETIRFDQLTDWTLRPEDGIKHYSGTAFYRKTFDLGGPVPVGRRTYLDLGTVHSMARVRLNGHDLGLVWCAPWRVETTGAFQDKDNRLEIEVVNTWANRIIGDQALPKEKRFTDETTPVLSVSSPLVPAGLVGPVALVVQ